MHGFISGLSNLFYCISLFVPLPYYFDNCNVVISSEVRQPVLPSLFFSLKIVLSILGFLHPHTKLKKKKFVLVLFKMLLVIRLELH